MRAHPASWYRFDECKETISLQQTYKARLQLYKRNPKSQDMLNKFYRLVTLYYKRLSLSSNAHTGRTRFGSARRLLSFQTQTRILLKVPYFRIVIAQDIFRSSCITFAWILKHFLDQFYVFSKTERRSCQIQFGFCWPLTSYIACSKRLNQTKLDSRLRQKAKFVYSLQLWLWYELTLRHCGDRQI